jgi:hypothetical protein
VSNKTPVWQWGQTEPGKEEHPMEGVRLLSQHQILKEWWQEVKKKFLGR